MVNENQNYLVNEHVAAKILSKGVQSLRNDRHLSRGLPYIKLSKSVRYSLQDIYKHIDENRITPEEI